MKTIELTKGFVAKVDDEDYESLNQKLWCVSKGVKNTTYYAVRGTRKKGKYKGVSMHREIMNPQSGEVVDHINHDTLDNRRCNLRIITQHENLLNRYANKNSNSKYKGVFWHDAAGKWYSQFKNQHIGYFDKEEDAALAYNAVAFAKVGELSLLNKVPNVPPHRLTTMPSSYNPYKKLNPYRGVRRRSYSCYEAYIQYKCNRYVIGYFPNEYDAVLAFNKECDKLGVSKRKNKIRRSYENREKS